MDRISQKMSYATKWSSMAEIVSKMILPIVNMILARLLTPEAFGVVATITIAISFAEIFQDAGFQKYIIQNEFDSDIEYDRNANVAFWTNLVLSLFLCLIIIVFKRPIANLIGGNGMETEIVVASISLPIFAISSLQISYYKRNFQYQRLFWARIIPATVPLLVTVPLAFILKNHWALIIGTIVRNLTQSLVLYYGSKWKPRFYYSVKLLKKMLSFCLWTLMESITIWLTANASVFVVTHILGIEAVGLYKTSMSTVTAVTGVISGATLSVLFSALSRLQNDNKAFFSTFYSYQKVVAIFVIPLGIGMWLYKDLLVKILLGNQWLECMNFVGMYSFASVFGIITNAFFSELYRAKGRPDVSMFAQVLYLLFLIPAIVLAAKNGFEVLCVTATVNVFVFFLIHFVLARHFFGVKLKKIAESILPAFFAAGIMAVFSLIVQAFFSNVVIRIASAIVCVPVYLLAVLLQPSLRSFLETNELTAGTYKKLKCILCKK